MPTVIIFLAPHRTCLFIFQLDMDNFLQIVLPVNLWPFPKLWHVFFYALMYEFLQLCLIFFCQKFKRKKGCYFFTRNYYANKIIYYLIRLTPPLFLTNFHYSWQTVSRNYLHKLKLLINVPFPFFVPVIHEFLFCPLMVFRKQLIRIEWLKESPLSSKSI